METILSVKFFANSLGSEPSELSVFCFGSRACLQWIAKPYVRTTKTEQLGWPLGMPELRHWVRHWVRHLGGGLWEVRSLLDNRIARVLFVLSGSTMVLLHGFIKKQQETPKADLDLAIERHKELKRK